MLRDIIIAQTSNPNSSSQICLILQKRQVVKEYIIHRRTHLNNELGVPQESEIDIAYGQLDSSSKLGASSILARPRVIFLLLVECFLNDSYSSGPFWLQYALKNEVLGILTTAWHNMTIIPDDYLKKQSSIFQMILVTFAGKPFAFGTCLVLKKNIRVVEEIRGFRFLVGRTV
ncbi:hypothetical protein EDD18DRAFT_1102739 [Armillaria luteobubalina]|uniref:Uncharacterized protein n=1 Tax=Armillaria luteobubalina TaxID=153913 RepID=A0AA39QCK2_9AGAR|nr:hypothetical protein EDD18DRAFT_1102739 [Armillaria luteobubalina]